MSLGCTLNQMAQEPFFPLPAEKTFEKLGMCTSDMNLRASFPHLYHHKLYIHVNHELLPHENIVQDSKPSKQKNCKRIMKSIP